MEQKKYDALIAALKRLIKNLQKKGKKKNSDRATQTKHIMAVTRIFFTVKIFSSQCL